LGRTGTTFACEHDGVRPDVFILGKALAGGIVPMSAVVADEAILGVFKPGEHGSTFGGNPVACAIGRRVVAMLRTGEFQEAATRLGADLLSGRGGGDPPDRRGDPRPRPLGGDPARRGRTARSAVRGAAPRAGRPGEGHA